MKNQLMRRFSELGLESLLNELFEPGSPLALLSSQALLVAEPLLSTFTDTQSILSISSRLEGLESADESSLKEVN